MHIYVFYVCEWICRLVWLKSAWPCYICIATRTDSEVVSFTSLKWSILSFICNEINRNKKRLLRDSTAICSYVLICLSGYLCVHCPCVCVWVYVCEPPFVVWRPQCESRAATDLWSRERPLCVSMGPIGHFCTLGSPSSPGRPPDPRSRPGLASL